MASKLIASHREGAEIYHGTTLCKQKTQELLDHFHLPKGLMPLSHINEFGYNKITGFIWLNQEKTVKYLFKELGLSSYGAEITAFIGDRQLKKLTGVKSKEMMIWITVSDISVDDTKVPSKICFANSMGLSKSYPVIAVEDEPKEMK
ncbi:hypothetical protein E1A91_D04G152900v1 [Gossypium mustelinum]|uniref:DUF538 domain-containing protein n=5 Tax=Gossypium TaxID=3633 RepID=A0A0D2V590_GOSRA|nr:uncharacterized protein LOC105779061 [Gossypium raimondii]KAB2035403.1 hypothetical protein ES319_D04G150300v1 [Gossypium barbadense]TYG74152.1 hypothetical protein ES288_D04G160300v1 [Gossypium darwinii]TYH77548.1 hypothetical protein ES332_D04G162300v1 [Gossypium tomentosum]TYI87682.1 hypothetical protein E1A91_D04G152900v1 [Gossypium mustelinum]KJB76944.1 hypothetical protein B456_012G113800 [Gossypium raimondii]